MEKATTSRVNYLDWLRIAAIIGVLLYHSARPFVNEDPWHINNPVTSDILTEFNFWISRFRMPLLFFISGAVTWFMVQRRTAGDFIMLRVRRLFIPLVAGMLIIVPPQVYMERLTQGYQGSYGEFYLSIFQFEIYPEGNFSWHHLWFIAYLFLYDLLLAPFFKWCARERSRKFVSALRFFGRGKNCYWLMLPTVLMFSRWVMDYPGTNDLIHDKLYFFYWLSFVVVGFLCMAQPAIMESIERNRRFSLGLAFLFIILLNAIRWTGFEFEHIKGDWGTYLYLARYPLNTWFWLFAIAGYGKRYLTKPFPAKAYVNESIYPFYILHQTIIVIIAYFVVRSADDVGLKYTFIVLTTFAASMLLYQLFIRPFRITRLLFGMKPMPSGEVKTKRPDEQNEAAIANGIKDNTDIGTKNGESSAKYE